MTNSSFEQLALPDAAVRAQTVKPATMHSRFIPREELGTFANWMPGNFGSNDPMQSMRRVEPAAPPPPAAPSEAVWMARVDAARRQGAQEGYQNGYRDGLVALESFKQSFAQQTTAQIGALLQAMQREIDALQPQLAEGVTRVALELARQVLRHELDTHPEVVCGVAEQAVQALVHSAGHIQLQVHPLDVPLVREGAAEQLAARGAQVMANPSLQRGDCVIESDVGTLDARVASRWVQATANLAMAHPWQQPAAADPEAGS